MATLTRENNPGANGPAVPPKPTLMPVIRENVPEVLRRLRRWVCWRWTWNGKKWDKPPYDPRTGRHASSTDQRTWVAFDVALAAHQRGEFDGIGIVLGDLGDGRWLSGADYDDVIRGGKVEPWAFFTAAAVNSYGDVSPSGTGLKQLVFRRLGPGGCVGQGLGFEVYDSGRYFTVTGHRCEWLPSTISTDAAYLDHARRTLIEKKGRSIVEWVNWHPGILDRPSGDDGASLPTLKRSRPFVPVCADPQTDRELALEALEHISSARAEGYHDWLAVGMALHSVSDDLLGAWDSWSKASRKFAEGICARKWRSFGRFTGKRYTLGSLIHWAKETGWVPPGGRRRREYLARQLVRKSGQKAAEQAASDGASEPSRPRCPKEHLCGNPKLRWFEKVGGGFELDIARCNCHRCMPCLLHHKAEEKKRMMAAVRAVYDQGGAVYHLAATNADKKSIQREIAKERKAGNGGQYYYVNVANDRIEFVTTARVPGVGPALSLPAALAAVKQMIDLAVLRGGPKRTSFGRGGGGWERSKTELAKGQQGEPRKYMGKWKAPKDTFFRIGERFNREVRTLYLAAGPAMKRFVLEAVESDPDYEALRCDLKIAASGGQGEPVPFPVPVRVLVTPVPANGPSPLWSDEEYDPAANPWA
jgi:hypothetical protein